MQFLRASFVNLSKLMDLEFRLLVGAVIVLLRYKFVVNYCTGHYVPQLSQAIVKHNNKNGGDIINLKGFMVWAFVV